MIKKLNIIKGDFFGGVIASIIALPQALAFGVASGLGAAAGIWGAIVLSFIGAIVGLNCPIISGPTGPSAIIIAHVYALMNGDISNVFLILAFSAIIQMIISITSIPSLIKYVPYPVISGFLSGIGIIIIILQISPILGGQNYSSVLLTLKNIPLCIQNVNFDAVLLGFISLLIVFLIPKNISKYIPSQIIALILGSLICFYFNFDVDKIPAITFEIPKFTLNDFNFTVLSNSLTIALSISFVLTSESLLTGLVMESLAKKKYNPKKLVFSQGLGNLVCSFFGIMQGSAATMRSVAAYKIGSTTTLSAIFSSLILLIALYKFSPLISQIPICVLSAILIKIGHDILDLKIFKIIKHAPKDDILTLCIVIFLTVFYNLIFAIITGIVLASILYAKRIADNTNIKETYNPEGYSLDEEKTEKDSHYKIRILHIDGQFFFGSISQIVSHFDEMLGVKYIILTYSNSHKLDMSAIFALEDIIIRLDAQKIKLCFVASYDEIYKQLEAIKKEGFDLLLYKNEQEAIDFALENINGAIK